MEFYRKHRPRKMSDVYGNGAMISSIKSMIRESSVPHALMFTGPSGTGKTTIARALARALKCGKMDYREIDIADFRGIDTVRELRRTLDFAPTNGETKVICLDEVHKMTGDAQNALLKALEECPEFVYFVLCTTEPEKVIKTVRTRCTTFQTRLLEQEEMVPLLRSVLGKEKLEVPDKYVKAVANASGGCARVALNMLEKCLHTDVEHLDESFESIVESESKIIHLCRALIKGEPWKKIAGIVKSLEDDPESVRRAVLGYCSAVLLNGDNGRAYLIMDAFAENYYDTGKAGLVMSCYQATHS